MDRLIEVAREKKATPAQIALTWVLSKEIITTPIVGISKAEHLEQAIEALDIELSREEVAYLEELYQPRDLIGHFGGEAMAGDYKDG